MAVAAQGRDAGTTSRALASPLELLPSDGRLLHLIGEKDLGNRYASTVMVEVDDPTVELPCSGILLSPRLVLTAGHCVCTWRGSLIDASMCVKQARVTMIRHEPGEGSSKPVLLFGNHVGQVRPHPEFKVTLDARGSVMTSQADLAVILLEKPVKSSLAEVPLAEEEARAGEFLVTAGYGNEKGLGGEFGARYFKKGKVTKPLTFQGGRILYAPQGEYFNTGYRGGPCFRETGSGQWLMGIVSLGTDTEMSFTSTFFYRNWLRAQQQHTTMMNPTAPQRP